MATAIIKQKKQRQPDRAKPYILNESLLYPRIVIDPETDKPVTIAYDITTLLATRQNDRPMTGLLTADLDDGLEWGVIPVPHWKAERWAKMGRLIKRVAIQKTSGYTRVRYVFSEPEEWESMLTEEESFWLNSLIEIDQALVKEQEAATVVCQTLAELGRRVADELKRAEVAQGRPGNAPKPKKKKAKKKRNRDGEEGQRPAMKAKHRRKRDRFGRGYGADYQEMIEVD